MDANRFATFLQPVSGNATRRGLLAILEAARGGEYAIAKKNKEKCRRGRQECGGKCRPKCHAGQTRNLSTCNCCLKVGSLCGSQIETQCCSGNCAFPTPAGLTCSP